MYYLPLMPSCLVAVEVAIRLRAPVWQPSLKLQPLMRAWGNYPLPWLLQTSPKIWQLLLPREASSILLTLPPHM